MNTRRWLQQAVRRTADKHEQQVFYLLVLGVVMALIVGALYLVNVAGTSTIGRQLEALLLEREQLEHSNEQLRIQIAELRSVPRLIARAEELGFRQVTQGEIEYLFVEGYRIVEQQTVAPIELSPLRLPEYDETLWGWIRLQANAMLSQFEAYNQLSTEG